MKKITVYQVDSFTTQIFGGNPAGVVADANALTDEEMKNIAREMNLSETAFILNPTKKNADIKLRYFTSGKSEITFCGHATIAALYEIGRADLCGTKKNGEYLLRIETNAGILPMEIIKKSADDITIRFTAPEVKLKKYKSQHAEFAKRFGLPVSALNKKSPVMIDTNLNYIYLSINSLKELGHLQFNFQQIEENFKNENIIVFCLLTPETFDTNNTIHSRGLAPLVGVPEDPFTGSMQTGLATYSKLNGLIPQNTKQLKTEQGHFIQRPGFATIDFPKNKDSAMVVSGKAMHIFSGEITL